MNRLAAIVVLWFPFSISALISIPVLFVSMLLNIETVWRPVGKAMDKLLSTLLGFSGEHTLSAELGACDRLKIIRVVLDKIQQNHCENSARKEGLIL